jgi:glutathione S-transferase
MEPLVLYIGTRALSSWSLRPYLALAHTGLRFEAREILLDYGAKSRAEIAKVSPSGRVPCLHHGDLVVWDSLAICEYVHELAPEAGLWPADRAARARARAVSAEMHAGFAALRQHMSMQLVEDRAGQGHHPDALADAARVMEIWRDCRARVPAGAGPFLFGAFTIADAMFAPVVTRFATYGVALDAVCSSYAAAVESLPAMQAWRREARGAA